ncbi:MAG: hypothetical protein LUH40_00610 [Clostridiales bacterium]|nr:hypothetical protein [Clostridiales bacterium]
MDNKKKLTIVLVVLAVVCVFAVLSFSGVIDLSNIGSEEASTDDNSSALTEDDYKSSASASSSSSLSVPYLETNIDNLYYTMAEDGTVVFYMYDSSANTFTETAASGTYTVTAVMSEENITADVTYYKDGDNIAGYGLYTGTDGEYNLYSYAFFRLTNFGEGYTGASSDSCLLLVDTTEDDFYSNEKIYEEPFTFYYDDCSTVRLLSEANRTVGLDGTKRADYSILNDTAVNAAYSQTLFFSGRHYSEDDERVDLLRSGGSGNNTDNVLLVSDVLGYWIEYTDEGVLYVSVDDSENVFVGLYNLSADTSETIKTFEGVSRDDVLISNGYIYIVTSNIIYSIDSDTEAALGYDNAGNFKADLFKASDDVFVLRGYVESVSPVLIYGTTADGSVTKALSNSDFTNIVNPIVASSSQIMITVASNDKFSYYIYAG